MSSFLVGGQVRVRVKFTVDNVATDPTNVTAIVKPPTDAAVSYVYGSGGVVRVSAGVYYLDQALASAGVWGIAWEATGAVVAVAETSVSVRARTVVA